jgi:hypothetical protein
MEDAGHVSCVVCSIVSVIWPITKHQAPEHQARTCGDVGFSGCEWQLQWDDVVAVVAWLRLRMGMRMTLGMGTENGHSTLPCFIGGPCIIHHGPLASN